MKIATKILSVLVLFNTYSCNSTSMESGNETSSKNEADVNSITVNQVWELPSVLKEVSGIAYMDENRFACIQDEDGIIFIFNKSTSEIEREINFAGGGDYEGIAIAGETAYVLKSDGGLFEIGDWQNENPKVTEHKTALNDHDVEGLCYDQKNNRLLMVIKESDTGGDDYKGIYGFDLSTKKFIADPVFRIDLKDARFDNLNGKKKGKIHPSEINIHPQTGDIYIIEGRDPKLLIMDSKGEIKSLQKLNKKDFPQAEGIAFSPDGKLLISNEGGKDAGNILEVSLSPAKK